MAGPDDVDVRTLEDVSNWLRVLRLHVRLHRLDSLVPELIDRNIPPTLSDPIGETWSL